MSNLSFIAISIGPMISMVYLMKEDCRLFLIISDNTISPLRILIVTRSGSRTLIRFRFTFLLYILPPHPLYNTKTLSPKGRGDLRNSFLLPLWEKVSPRSPGARAVGGGEKK